MLPALAPSQGKVRRLWRHSSQGKVRMPWQHRRASLEQPAGPGQGDKNAVCEQKCRPLYHVASMSMLFVSEGFSNLDVLVFSFPVAAVQSLLASSAIIFAVNAVLHCYHQPRHRAQVSVQCSRVDTEADHDESDDIRRRRFWHCRNAKVI